MLWLCKGNDIFLKRERKRFFSFVLCPFFRTFGFAECTFARQIKTKKMFFCFVLFSLIRTFADK